MLPRLLSVIELPDAPTVTTTGVVPTGTLTVRVMLVFGPTLTVSVVVTPLTG